MDINELSERGRLARFLKMNANYSNFLTAPLSLSYNWTPSTVTNLSGDGKNNQFKKFDIKTNSTGIKTF